MQLAPHSACLHLSRLSVLITLGSQQEEKSEQMFYFKRGESKKGEGRGEKGKGEGGYTELL